MCLNQKFEKKRKQYFSAVFGGCVDHVFKPEMFEVDHVFKPSLVYISRKGFFLQEEAFLKNR